MTMNSLRAVKGLDKHFSTLLGITTTTSGSGYFSASRILFCSLRNQRCCQAFFWSSLSTLSPIRETNPTPLIRGICGIDHHPSLANIAFTRNVNILLFRNSCQLANFQRKERYMSVIPGLLGSRRSESPRQLSDDAKDSTYLEDEELTPNMKIEKQLMKFMDMWELAKAIKLLRLAVTNNIIPNQTVILNLLQQLANLGEVEFLVDMHQFLLEEKLCSNTAFYTSLQQAYFNSGRIEEGVDFLRKIYHLTREYQDVDVYFVLLTVMILRHFPDKEHLMTQFVKDLGQRVPEDHEVRAALWKCYILAECFEKAKDFLQDYTQETKQFLPIMINDIIGQRNKVEADRLNILQHLINDCSDNMSKKQRALVYWTYCTLLVEEGQYKTCIDVLEKARTQNLPLKREKLLPLLNVLEMTVQNEKESGSGLKLQDLKNWVETLE